MNLFKSKSDSVKADPEKNKSFKEDSHKPSNRRILKKKEIEKWKIPKTVQDSIPYMYIYKNGIMELTPGVYSKSYVLGDANFKITSRQGQEKIFNNYSTMLSTFGETVKVEVTIWNKNMDIAEFQKQVLMEMQNDDLNE